MKKTNRGKRVLRRRILRDGVDVLEVGGVIFLVMIWPWVFESDRHLEWITNAKGSSCMAW
jgi:hypothetical protein